MSPSLFVYHVSLKPIPTPIRLQKIIHKKLLNLLFPIFFQIEDTWAIIFMSNLFRQNVSFIRVSCFFKANSNTDSPSKNYSQKTSKSSFPNFFPNRRYLWNNHLVKMSSPLLDSLRPMDINSPLKLFRKVFKSSFPNFLSNNKLLFFFFFFVSAKRISKGYPFF